MPSWVAVGLWICVGIAAATVAWVYVWRSLSRKWVWLTVALSMLTETVWCSIVWIVFRIQETHSMPTSCNEFMCIDVLTCHTMSSWSMHVRSLYGAVGGFAAAVFISQGMLQHRPGAMELVYAILLGFCLVYASMTLMDVAFVLGCEAYPFGIISYITAFPGEHPLGPADRSFLFTLNYYPKELVDSRVQVNITTLYLSMTTLVVCLMACTTYQARRQVQLFQQGEAMLGPAYDVKSWARSFTLLDLVRTPTASDPGSAGGVSLYGAL
mmetsp:Transcript_106130/g.242971  ORF Transcript_106130/g.242971 Transcript_106130/m.242971 type:complete len:268 (+) Transcript_106130:144-947(+)